MIRANTNCYTMAFCQYDGHEDALLSIRDVDGDKIVKFTQALRDVKKAGFEPWGETKEGKEELEEIRSWKEKNKAASKEDATLFMGDLERGLDDNAE
jgi:hypothetical protein